MGESEPLAAVTGGGAYMTTTYRDGSVVLDARVTARIDDGWLHVEIEAPEDRIVGYAVTVNGKSLPISNEES